MSGVIVKGMSTGIIVPHILSLCGAAIGQSGVDYYAEIHTKPLNSYCHTIGMPFTIYGMLLWIPVLFNLSNRQYINIQKFLYTSYMTHYIFMDYAIGGATAVVYSVPLYYARKKMNSTFLYLENNGSDKHSTVWEYARMHLFIKGLMVSSGALILQECLGHWLSGDQASRAEAVPNAILYAMYYSISHIF